MVEDLLHALRQLDAHQVVVLTDDHVNALYPQHLISLTENFQCQKIVIPAGECHKSLMQAAEICQQLLSQQYDTSLVIVNFGGGMICDLGGFVASIYKRGVRYVNYPTTLISMIDAAIGGKVGVNMEHVKNCIGRIEQPAAIIPADNALLATLPQEELLSGFGEMVKYAVIGLPSLFQQLADLQELSHEVIQPQWIIDCASFKKHVVAVDPLDKKERHILNFGHTIGHAVESYNMNYKGLPHGVAVAIGILYEAALSHKFLSLSREELAQIQQLISRHFPSFSFHESMIDTLINYMLQDKKNQSGKINFTLLHSIGHAVTDCLIDVAAVRSFFQAQENDMYLS